jgi:hypothetical protein
MATKKPKLEEKPPVKKHGGARPGTGGAMPGAGRPAFVPTDAERKQVEAMSGYGLPIEQIAVLVRDGIHVETLRTHFRSELISGKAKANSGVGRTLFQKAMSGDTAAMIWWSKTQMRWKEVQHHELTGKDGGPIETVSLDVSKLSTDVLAQIMSAKTGGGDE